MTTTSNDPLPYAEPVSRLLDLGEPRPERRGIAPDGDPDWLDYSQYGIGPEHIDELIRLACDPVLNASEVQSSEMWAPLHAWRALGRLRAAPAVLPLLALMQAHELDDWIAEDLPKVFGLIGASAIGPMADLIADPATSGIAGGTAIAGLTAITLYHPECRPDCVAIMERTLRRRDHVDLDVNASIIAAILELKAIEAIEAVRDAFRRDAVDLSMAGDIEDVEIHLGLRERRDAPRRRKGSQLADIGQRMFTARAPTEKRKKVGRNEPCPCGSGRKYKKCCGSSTKEGPAPT